MRKSPGPFSSTPLPMPSSLPKTTSPSAQATTAAASESFPLSTNIATAKPSIITNKPLSAEQQTPAASSSRTPQALTRSPSSAFTVSALMDHDAQKMALPFATEPAPQEDVDGQIDLARKKRKVMQRDLHRLAVKFEELKEKYFYNKDRLLEEEKRLVHAGTHRDLLQHLDEIQQAHESRLQVANKRLALTQQALDIDCEAAALSSHTQLMAQRAALRWALQKETFDMLLQADQEIHREVQNALGMDADVQVFEEACGGVEDPASRFDRVGLLPGKIHPLAMVEREEDLTAIRQRLM